MYSSGLYGLESFPVTIEVGIGPGFGLKIVGTTNTAVREGFHRIRSALSFLGLRIPGKKITINLGPGDRPKSGTAFDLPIALGILLASAQLSNRRTERFVALGELSLDGEIGPIRGVVPRIIAAAEAGIRDFLIPLGNAEEATMVPGIRLFPISHLRHSFDFLEGRSVPGNIEIHASVYQNQNTADCVPWDDIVGQDLALRALEVSAAGNHHLLLLGPEGTGKTTLAELLSLMLPPLDSEEALEVARIYSAAGHTVSRELLSRRPVRKPHHGIARASLLGGGSIPVPGELSLAHRGVLLMDELPLFGRSLLNQLRLPLEEGVVRINRLRYSSEFPCDFLLVASANLYREELNSTVGARDRARSMLTPPLLDRIDLQVYMDNPSIHPEKIPRPARRTWQEVRTSVAKCRTLQANRFRDHPGIRFNSGIPLERMEDYCGLEPEEEQFLDYFVAELSLSMRSRDRIRKISRTLADLDGSERITSTHLAEAVQYRDLDRQCSD